jgi:dolichyl-phosphate beta-glucosyltransferase
MAIRIRVGDHSRLALSRRMGPVRSPCDDASEPANRGMVPRQGTPSTIARMVEDVQRTANEGLRRARCTLVMPAYNESGRIGSALAELYGYLGRPGPARSGGRPASEMGPVDVLVVDDGSTDETARIVEQFIAHLRPDQPHLELMRRPHAGKGAAVQAGMLAAHGEYVVFADADLATPPDQLPLLTRALDDHDLALGSRVHPDGSDRRRTQPLHRRLLGRVFHGLAAAWVTGPVPDTQCGFKGFRREAARDLFARQKIGGIVFDAEVIHLARRRGYSVAIVPVQWSDKRGSRMRLRPGLALRVVLDLFRIPLIHRDVARR